ncbi:MAG: nucleotide sugar dehydrogenase [Actinomycetota bacterium]
MGQGYVGLSLACSAAQAGFNIVGYDVDEQRIRDLSGGNLVVPGVAESLLEEGTASGKLRFSADPQDVAEADVIVICVPTPVRDQSPDLSHIVGACEAAASVLKGGRLVVLESTTYPGTTDQIVAPILERSGLTAGRDFLLAYSPERIDPGNEEYSFRRIPRIVGGITAESTGVAALFYGQLVDKVLQVSSCQAAELAKLLENTFRHVNVALVNEMAMLCHEVGIDVWEVVDAAASKPFGFMPFYPGPGVGGHCIPLDPAYLAWQVRRDAGHQFRILEQAQDINAQMPTYLASRIGEALNDASKPVRGARILVLGVSYKPDVGDMRESPALKAMTALHKRGAKVTFHDPFIERVPVNGLVLERVQLSERAVQAADCVALLTPHSNYDLQWIADHSQLLFDARNAYADDRRPDVVRL